MSNGDRVFTVDKFCDKLTIRTKAAQAKIDGGSESFARDIFRHYFDTEAKAKAFLVDRSRTGVKDAEKYLLMAKRRLKRVEKKFGPE